MKEYRGYLIDLDGTVYEGTDKIEAAFEFVNELRRKKIPFLFLTNNSSRKREAIVSKLKKMGLETKKEEIFTSSNATANYIANTIPDARIYVIGEEGLQSALKEKGLCLTSDNPDTVVIGIDRNISYEKFEKSCIAIRNGANFISTNPDLIVPTERGMVPGNGSLTSVLTVSTGIKPIFIGKPEPIIINQAIKLLGIKKEDTLLIGDNYETDIMGGIKSGIDTLLVHTGVTSKDDLYLYQDLPTYSLDSLKEYSCLQEKIII